VNGMLLRRLDSAELRATTDEELLARFVSGDYSAFDVIVGRYEERLLNFVYRFLNDQETAQDVVQETFLRVYRKRKEYKAIAHFSTWLFTIAGNLAKSELRRRKRWRFLSLDSGGDDDERPVDLPDERHLPDDVVADRMTEARIQEAINALPPKYRQAVLLRDVEGMSYQEIAQIANCPVGTIKSRVNRARLKLQKKLRIDGRDNGLGDFSDTER
jgi:RNA polymerase sigma-70 factor (ECF subfamily)